MNDAVNAATFWNTKNPQITQINSKSGMVYTPLLPALKWGSTT